MNAEAAACTREVFDYGFSGLWVVGFADLEVSGMIVRVLIPVLVQAMIQWLLKIAMIAPRIKVEEEIHFACYSSPFTFPQ